MDKNKRIFMYINIYCFMVIHKNIKLYKLYNMNPTFPLCSLDTNYTTTKNCLQPYLCIYVKYKNKT